MGFASDGVLRIFVICVNKGREQKQEKKVLSRMFFFAVIFPFLPVWGGRSGGFPRSRVFFQFYSVSCCFLVRDKIRT